MGMEFILGVWGIAGIEACRHLGNGATGVKNRNDNDANKQ